jgi:hypothetical protein
MSEETNKFKINVNSRDGALIFCCFATFWLTIGTPDIIDAIIEFLMK